MSLDRSAGKLADIPIGRIRQNSENPRVAFRQRELEELQESIRQYGVQVPIAVFKRGSEYVLIDGERRWRCAAKLNFKTIPALVQEEPSPLENLLLMFNIHSLREQWDLLTVALKLPKVVALLQKQLGRAPNEGELSAKTGLSRSVIRRCRLLMDLPSEHQQQLLEELKKPKAKQTLSEDLYIEIEKALKTVIRAMPDAVPDRDVARNALIAKYKSKVIDNIVDIRKIAKIARSTSLGIEESAAKKAVKRILTDPKYSIARAWNETASEAYSERDVVSRIDQLLEKLDQLSETGIDDDVREKLEELIARATALVGSDA